MWSCLMGRYRPCLTENTSVQAKALRDLYVRSKQLVGRVLLECPNGSVKVVNDLRMLFILPAVASSVEG